MSQSEMAQKLDLCDRLSLDTIETASGLTQQCVSRTTPRKMSSPPHLLIGTRGFRKTTLKLECLTFSCKGTCPAEPHSRAVHQRPTLMLKTAFLIHFAAVAMSVALDRTQDAHKTLTVAAALPGTVMRSVTEPFFLPQPSFQAQLKDRSQSGGSHETREK